MSIISAKDVSFGYDGENVLDNISFEINKGDYIGIIGSNGAGKSTLVKLILGEIKPISGEINLFNKNINRFHNWNKISYIPQNAGQISKDFPATVFETVMSSMYSKIGAFKLPRKAHKKKVHEALKLVGMDEYSKRLIGKLSGGQQQRVIIASALVTEPEIIFLDEPSNGIDSASAGILYDLLAKLNKEKKLTVVMITHDITGISNSAGRIFFLENNTLCEISAEQSCLHEHTHLINREVK